jgi:hypothetical protein
MTHRLTIHHQATHHGLILTKALTGQNHRVIHFLLYPIFLKHTLITLMFHFKKLSRHLIEIDKMVAMTCNINSEDDTLSIVRI